MARTKNSKNGPLLAPLTDLKLSDWNPRIIMTRQFEQLCESIKRDPGFLEERPILATTDGTIYAGHQRYRAVVHLYDQGWTSPWGTEGQRVIPARFSDVDETTAQERSVRDNNSYGQYQEQELAEILAGIAERDAQAVGTLGFTDDEVQNILASVGVGSSVDPFSGRSAEPEDRPPPGEADAPIQHEPESEPEHQQAERRPDDGEDGMVEVFAVTCPQCSHEFEIEA